MTDEKPKASVPAEEIRLGFRSAFAGLWFFTWRSQWRWSRLAWLGFVLLFLPVLAWLTLAPIRKPKEMDSWLPNPAVIVSLYRKTPNGSKEVDDQTAEKLVELLQKRKSEIRAEPPQVRNPYRHREDEWRRFDAAVREDAKNNIFASKSQGPLSLFGSGDMSYYHFSAYMKGVTDSMVQNFRDEMRQNGEPYLMWVVSVYFLLILPMYCLTNAGALIRDELQNDTLGFLVTRPVSRTRLFLGKFLAQLVFLEIILGIETGLLLLVGVTKNVPEIGSLAALLFAIQAGAVVAWASLSAFVGMLTRWYLILGVLYGFIVELGIGAIPTNINSLSITRNLKTLLINFQPVNTVFDKWADGRPTFALGSWNVPPNLTAIVCLTLAAAIFLGAAVALFTFREYSHNEEMQK